MNTVPDTRPAMETTQARLNVTFAGNNGDLIEPVFFDATDAEIKSWVTEAVTSGSIPGIPADLAADFTNFVVDRFQPNEERPYNLIQLRPKTPFGRNSTGGTA